MKLILNERKHAEELLVNGLTDNKILQHMVILVKYYLSKDMEHAQIFDSVVDFFSKNQKVFKVMRWDDSLNGIIAKAIKGDWRLLEIDSIGITKNELSTIKAIKNIRLEKIAFILLIYSKIYNIRNGNKSNWANCELKEVFTDSHIVVGQKDRLVMLHKLVQMELIEPSGIVDCTNLKVLFTDESSEVEIVISDFRDYILEYMRWKGENIKNCECCNKNFKIKVNNQRMCDECLKEFEKERKRKWWNENKK